MTIFFTSDLHFGHENIIKYCRRPFLDRYMMNAELTSRWNHAVQPNDVVYVLGDVSFMNRERTLDKLRELNGSKVLLRGNHDPHWLTKTGLWIAQLEPNAVLRLPHPEAPNDLQHALRVQVNHYPPVHSRDGVSGYFLHGHSHGTKPITIPGVYDVGVDANDYAPVSWEVIYDRLSTAERYADQK